MRTTVVPRQDLTTCLTLSHSDIIFVQRGTDWDPAHMQRNKRGLEREQWSDRHRTLVSSLYYILQGKVLIVLVGWGQSLGLCAPLWPLVHFPIYNLWYQHALFFKIRFIYDMFSSVFFIKQWRRFWMWSRFFVPWPLPRGILLPGSLTPGVY